MMDGLIQILGISPELFEILLIIVKAVLSVSFLAVMGGLMTWIERRIAGRMQSRIGPNRVGPQGLLQWLADGIKLMMKEDLIPKGADRTVFKIAPYLCVTGVFGTFVVLPWGEELIASDLNVGILYFLSITSLVVIGTLMAGWSSNNKWSLLGGMRSAAQIVSYEIPAALSLLVPIMIAGGLSLGGLMSAQGWLPWDWMVFQNPFALVAFFIFFTSALAEGNRAPFDLPEAESELVSGFATEYSSFRYAAFFLAEWGNVYVIGAVTTAIFLGGGNLPELLAGYTVISVALFMAKTFFIVFVVIWIRWTLPRFRVDQLMELSWKYLLPIGIITFFGQAVYMLISNQLPLIDEVMGYLVFLSFIAVMIKFVGRVKINIREQATSVNTVGSDRDEQISPTNTALETAESK